MGEDARQAQPLCFDSPSAALRGALSTRLRIGETDHGNRNGETIWALKDVSFTVEQGAATQAEGLWWEYVTTVDHPFG